MSKEGLSFFFSEHFLPRLQQILSKRHLDKLKDVNATAVYQWTADVLSQQWVNIRDINILSQVKTIISHSKESLQCFYGEWSPQVHYLLQNGTVLYIIFTMLLVLIAWRIASRRQQNEETDDGPYIMSAFDLAKTAYEPGHVDSLIQLMKGKHFDVNYPMPSSGLTLFLCACISGEKKLVEYLLRKGGDISVCSNEGDGALYLATYGILCSPNPDPSLIQLLVEAGCDVNAQNKTGYTPLHRAASKGHIDVIRCLLENRADPCLPTHSGIYPFNLAENAGHHSVAELLNIGMEIDETEENIMKPCTPSRVRQSSYSEHVTQSPRPSHKQTLQTISNGHTRILT